MIDSLEELFESLNDEFLKFERVEAPLSRRPDLCAFILLEELLPGGTSDLICSAEHDEIWLDVDVEELAKVATEGDIRTLVRCGVRYDSDINSLALFV